MRAPKESSRSWHAAPVARRRPEHRARPRAKPTRSCSPCTGRVRGNGRAGVGVSFRAIRQIREHAMPQLEHWDSFYVIVGSSAGALIGLQFVVLTLIAERPPVGAAGASAAFGTPTIVHFGTALFLSAAPRAPWQTAAPLAVLLGLAGLAGAAYTANGVRRMRRQSAYTP